MKRLIEWQTKDGRKVTVTVELETNRTINADGDKITVPVCEMNITAEVEGMGVVGMGGVQNVVVNTQGIVARIGKLAITADNLDRINEAIAEVEATPEWKEKVRRHERDMKVGEEYEAHRIKMEKIMGRE